MATNSLLFRVDGMPQGKGRHRTANINGQVRAYTPKKTREYEKAVGDAAKHAAMLKGWVKSDDPIRLNICAWFPVPTSWPKKKREAAQRGDIYPTVKPDADNIGKAISDGLNDIVYNDDKQVVECIVKKRYCPADKQPHVVVFVEPMMGFTEMQANHLGLVNESVNV